MIFPAPVTQNSLQSQAASYYERACDLSKQSFCLSAAKLYEHALDNPKRAKQVYDRACWNSIEEKQGCEQAARLGNALTSSDESN